MRISDWSSDVCSSDLIDEFDPNDLSRGVEIEVGRSRNVFGPENRSHLEDLVLLLQRQNGGEGSLFRSRAISAFGWEDDVPGDFASGALDRSRLTFAMSVKNLEKPTTGEVHRTEKLADGFGRNQYRHVDGFFHNIHKN